VGTLLDAYLHLLERGKPTAPLVLAGGATAAAGGWLDRLARPPLQGQVRHLGYVPDAERERLYTGARLLVLPSLDEGFGLPVLEAMSAGVPVVASDRGSLPEVLGGAGIMVTADDVGGLAEAMARMLEDPAGAAAAARRGLERASQFSWDRAATALRTAYESALKNRRARGKR
jgi:alpha-1,3-rhamnosyl/mannosyltransferase